MKIASLKTLPALLALTWLGLGTLPAKQDAPLLFLTPSTLYVEGLLPPPPAPGSEAGKADLASVLEIHGAASLPELKRARQDSHDSVWDFAEVLGPGFAPATLPKTAALFDQMGPDLKEAIKVAKTHFQRPRPPTAEEPQESEKDKNDYAYPSGHASRATAWATLLADLYPDRRQALLDKAGRMGWNRIVLGKHFPADVAAGKTYGDHLAQELLKSPAFLARWREVKAEVASAPLASAAAAVPAN